MKSSIQVLPRSLFWIGIIVAALLLGSCDLVEDPQVRIQNATSDDFDEVHFFTTFLDVSAGATTEYKDVSGGVSTVRIEIAGGGTAQTFVPLGPVEDGEKRTLKISGSGPYSIELK